jgi:integrase
MGRRRRRGEYGKGTVFRRNDRGTWSVAWRQDGQRRYEHGFETEADARKQLAMVLGDLAAGRERARTTAVTLNTLADQWLIARKATHRSAYDDRNRWDNHLRTTLGTMRPNAVSVAVLKGFIASKRRSGLSTTTVNLLVRLLSTLYTDLVEDGHAQANPCRMLSKSTRATHLKPAHDPKLTPFLERMEDVVAVYQALGRKSPTVATAYAIGALAGLRTSEVRALAWDHIDLQRGTIHVQVQVERRKGRDPKTWSDDGTQVLKDGESRVLPVQPSLASILVDWKKSTSGKGLVCPPIRQGGRRFLDDHTMSTYLREVLADLKLAKPGLGWYEATRHTMASQYIISSGSLETLQRMLGHSTVLVTERYAHLRPGHFNLADRNRITIDFGKVQLATELDTDGKIRRAKNGHKAA